MGVHFVAIEVNVIKTDKIPTNGNQQMKCCEVNKYKTTSIIIEETCIYVERRITAPCKVSFISVTM